MLPRTLLERPVAHRAFHDVTQARPENSRAAIRAAIAAGYGIEIDLQLSRDGQAMVFHDYDMARLTGVAGPIQLRSAPELAETQLLHGDEGVPTFEEVLRIVAGQVPLLIEVKDQDGGMGPNIGALEHATVAALDGYQGDVALMSFNPHSVAELARLAPQRPRGLTTCSFLPEEWQVIRPARLEELRTIPDYDRVGACFISHNCNDLSNPRVAELKAQGVPILCWTVRSPEQEAEAREIADNVTFEGYTA
ncbi:Glycerophosphoryl diester phosphodiesterase [Pelagimonas phthalicica]|uniref:Glycerophosphoryl diester phosphodiesterase n=1 Tax=Pelagimonas phthalicica TaxID=1037362 RepID=A0A238J9B9_9RHOB|nr:glycerophosphodiester phosphodiesterase family protein [Pelagimonas phthalicica]TDS94695.1 glycerophosphoryl diester phosphodiesterase [Pelagimonas phthalicica]SMX26777.1 Glycerophosphoryl diester phosphodiesterase [Pelagimonas phthalicica]